MSSEMKMSSAAETADFPYKAISRAAIASVVLAVLSIAGFISAFKPMLFLAVIAILFSLYAINTIRRFPDEYTGKGLAQVSLYLGMITLIGGVTMHTVIYYTEVPEGYERVPFWKLQYPGEEEHDRPTELAFEIDGKPVFIKGYIHPSSGGGALRQFILVPDLGTCCFGGQPKSSDMIEVTLLKGQTVKANLRNRKLAGKFQLNTLPQEVTDFDNAVFYRMRVDMIK